MAAARRASPLGKRAIVPTMRRPTCRMSQVWQRPFIPKSILVDAGPLIAMLDRSGENHRQSKRLLEEFRGRMLTTWPVLARCLPLSLRAHADTLSAVGGRRRIELGGAPRNRTRGNRRLEGKVSRPADGPGQHLIAVGGGTDRHHGHPHDRLAGLLRVSAAERQGARSCSVAQLIGHLTVCSLSPGCGRLGAYRGAKSARYPRVCRVNPGRDLSALPDSNS